MRTRRIRDLAPRSSKQSKLRPAIQFDRARQSLPNASTRTLTVKSGLISDEHSRALSTPVTCEWSSFQDPSETRVRLYYRRFFAADALFFSVSSSSSALSSSINVYHSRAFLKSVYYFPKTKRKFAKFHVSKQNPSIVRNLQNFSDEISDMLTIVMPRSRFSHKKISLKNLQNVFFPVYLFFFFL